MLRLLCRPELDGACLDISLFRRAFCRVALSVLVFCLGIVLGSRASYAVDPAVDLAVEAFAAGGMAIGVPVGPTEKAFLKPLVQCAVDGRPVLECGKEALIQTVLGRLPGQSQAFAGCIARGGNLARCASGEMINKLPPQARPLASCVAQGRDISVCAREAGTAQLSAAERSALATLGNLNADGRVSLTQSTSSIQNIINVADGIAREDWEKVAINGGKAVAKYVIRTVLTALLTQAGSALAGPVIDALVENRMDLAIDLVKALKSGDPERIARATVQAYLYLSLPVVQACSLFPSGAVKEAVCGLVADILGEIADLGGKVVGTGAKEAEKKYNDLQDFITHNRDDCGMRWQYYDANFAFCKHNAAIAKNLDPERYKKIEGSLDRACRDHFRPCSQRLQVTIPNPFGDDLKIGSKSTEDRVSDICNPVRDKFRKEVDQLRRSLKDRAAAFARNYRAPELKLQHGEDCDARASQAFVIDCINALAQDDQDRVASASCRVDGKKLGIASSNMGACGDAAFVGEGANLRLSFQARCTYPVEPPPSPMLRPPPVQLQTPEGRCPEGTRPVGRYRCVPIVARPPPQVLPPPPKIVQPPPPVLPPAPKCGDGMVGTPPNCICASGTILVSGRCVQPCPPGMTGTQPNCRCPGGTVLIGGRCAEPCPSGMLGTPPNCRCAGGTVLIGGRCTRPCPPGMIGTPPNCRCPDGTVLSGGRCAPCPSGTTWSGGTCRPVSCPPGMVGRPPNCHRSAPPPPRVCPPGMTGTPPNCYRPAPPPPRVCPPGMTGTPPNCYRPAPPPPRVCPPGMTGTPPNCHRPAPPLPRVCPPGMVGRPPNCHRPTPPPPRVCPPGMTGRPPNCHRPTPPPPRVCPPGMTGRPPNCHRRATLPPRGCPQGYSLYQGRCVPRQSPVR